MDPCEKFMPHAVCISHTVGLQRADKEVPPTAMLHYFKRMAALARGDTHYFKDSTVIYCNGSGQFQVGEITKQQREDATTAGSSAHERYFIPVIVSMTMSLLLAKERAGINVVYKDTLRQYIERIVRTQDKKQFLDITEETLSALKEIDDSI